MEIHTAIFKDYAIFHWDKHKILPIEKLYGINPLNAVHNHIKYNYWHIGRFAAAKDLKLPSLSLFKRLMALAVQPIVEDKYSYMIAEIDSKLLKVMKMFGFGTHQIGKSINCKYIPICDGGCNLYRIKAKKTGRAYEVCQYDDQGMQEFLENYTLNNIRI